MTDINLVELLPGLSYLHHPHHRDGTPLKSQWIIGHPEERICFINSYNRNWLLDNIGWGLHFIDESVDYLGVSHDRQRQLFIAIFMENQNQSFWHGYPADYQVNIQDIPSEEVLSKWLEDEILSPAKIRKIVRGKACRL